MVLSVNERTEIINQRLLTLILVERKIELFSLKTEKKKSRVLGIKEMDNRLAWRLTESPQECTPEVFWNTWVCLEIHPAAWVPLPRDFNRARMKLIKGFRVLDKKKKKIMLKKQVMFLPSDNFSFCLSVKKWILYTSFNLIKQQNCLKKIKHVLLISESARTKSYFYFTSTLILSFKLAYIEGI